MLPDFRLVIASIAAAVMVVTLGLGTIAAFRTSPVGGLPSLTKPTDPSFADLGIRRPGPDPGAARSEAERSSGTWTAVAVPEEARSVKGTDADADGVDPTGAFGTSAQSRDGRGFIEQRIIIDTPSVNARDRRSPTVSSPDGVGRRDDIVAAAPATATMEGARTGPDPSATTVAEPRPVGPGKAAARSPKPSGETAPIAATPTQEASLRDASGKERLPAAAGSLLRTPPRKHGAQADASGPQAKSPIAGQKVRKARLVRRFRPDGYVPVFGPEQTFGPDRPF